MKLLCNKQLQQKLPDPFPLLRNGVWPRENTLRVGSGKYKTTGTQGGARLDFDWFFPSDHKLQVLANLANFAYDPINYEDFQKLNILDLFLGN